MIMNDGTFQCVVVVSEQLSFNGVAMFIFGWPFTVHYKCVCEGELVRRDRIMISIGHTHTYMLQLDWCCNFHICRMVHNRFVMDTHSQPWVVMMMMVVWLAPFTTLHCWLVSSFHGRHHEWVHNTSWNGISYPLYVIESKKAITVQLCGVVVNYDTYWKLVWSTCHWNWLVTSTRSNQIKLNWLLTH